MLEARHSIEEESFVSNRRSKKEERLDRFRAKIADYLRFVAENDGKLPRYNSINRHERRLNTFARNLGYKFTIGREVGEFDDEVIEAVRAGMLKGVTPADLVIRDEENDGVVNLHGGLSSGREIFSGDEMVCRRKGGNIIDVGSCLEDHMNASVANGDKLCHDCPQGGEIRKAYSGEDGVGSFLSKAERKKLGIID